MAVEMYFYFVTWSRKAPWPRCQVILWAEVATRGVLWKKVFLEISQNEQENTCARVSFLIKLEASGRQRY